MWHGTLFIQSLQISLFQKKSVFRLFVPFVLFLTPKGSFSYSITCRWWGSYGYQYNLFHPSLLQFLQLENQLAHHHPHPASASISTRHSRRPVNNLILHFTNTRNMLRLITSASKKFTSTGSSIPRCLSTAVSTATESTSTTPSVFDKIVTLNFVDPSGARRQVPGYIGKIYIYIYAYIDKY